MTHEPTPFEAPTRLLDDDDDAGLVLREALSDLAPPAPLDAQTRNSVQQRLAASMLLLPTATIGVAQAGSSATTATAAGTSATSATGASTAAAAGTGSAVSTTAAAVGTGTTTGTAAGASAASASAAGVATASAATTAVGATTVATVGGLTAAKSAIVALVLGGAAAGGYVASEELSAPPTSIQTSTAPLPGSSSSKADTAANNAATSRASGEAPHKTLSPEAAIRETAEPNTASDPPSLPLSALPSAPAQAPSAKPPQAPQQNTPAASGAASLAAEVELLRQAQSAISANPAQARQLLDSYDRRFPEGSLRSEYRALRKRLP